MACLGATCNHSPGERAPVRHAQHATPSCMGMRHGRHSNTAAQLLAFCTLLASQPTRSGCCCCNHCAASRQPTHGRELRSSSPLTPMTPPAQMACRLPARRRRCGRWCAADCCASPARSRCGALQGAAPPSVSPWWTRRHSPARLRCSSRGQQRCGLWTVAAAAACAACHHSQTSAHRAAARPAPMTRATRQTAPHSS